MFSTHAVQGAAAASSETDSAKITRLSSELTAGMAAVESQLGDIRALYAMIQKHAAETQSEIAAADEWWTAYYLARLEEDVSKLATLRESLEDVDTTHPYCLGCNGQDGFQLNQQAHTCIRCDSSSDERSGSDGD